MHYIVATIRQKFPELLSFETELFCTDKASQVSLENIVTDVHDLEKGMDLVKKEAELRVKGVQTHILRDFLNNSEDKLKKIKIELKNAQEAFKECVEYFGESSRNADAAAFFALIVRFTRAFKVILTKYTIESENVNVTAVFSLMTRKTNKDDVWSRQLLQLLHLRKKTNKCNYVTKLTRKNNRYL